MRQTHDLRAALSLLRHGEVRAALRELALPSQGAELRARAEQLARRTWMKFALRGVHQNDAHDQLDRAYRMPDPWHMASPQEQARFEQTNAIIRRELGGSFGRVLEIGCGEGHQTQHLAALAEHITGLDVSAIAVERAAKRLPEAEFCVGDLFSQPWARERGRFDLVTACEVLYYMSDMPAFLAAMDTLGRRCLVTYFAPAARKVEAHLRAMPNVKTDSFRYRDVEWVAAWWRGAADRG